MNIYHDYVFWALIAVSLLSIVVICISFRDSFDMGMSMLIILLLVVGCFGWAAIGNIHTVIDVTRNHSASVIKTPTSIIVTINDAPIKTITDVATYNILANKTNVLVTETGGITIYGNTNWNENYTVVLP